MLILKTIVLAIALLSTFRTTMYIIWYYSYVKLSDAISCRKSVNTGTYFMAISWAIFYYLY